MKRFMSRGEGVIAFWGLVLTVLWVLVWTVFVPNWEAVMLLAMAAGVTMLKAVWALHRERRRPAPADDEPQAFHQTSHGTALAGVAIVGLALGLEFGPWLLYLSAGLLLVALGGLVRENRAARDTISRLERREPAP